jgi:hypothetical protein
MFYIPMSLNRILLFISFFLISNSFGQYAAYFPNQFQSSVLFFQENKSAFKKISDSLGREESFIFSIVAPEIGHYNWMKNTLESNSLKVLYVQFGSRYSDFSVGNFQMKPSFIERIETEISQSTYLKSKYGYCLIPTNDERLKRIERIKRLELLEWQFKYLAVFIEITTIKYNKTFNSTLNELAFYSTVYNAGFQKSVTVIEQEYNRKRFPNMSDRKFNYSSISLEYYQFLMH